MLRDVAVVRTDVSYELVAYIISETRIGELVTTLVVTSNRDTLWRKKDYSCRPDDGGDTFSETSVLTRAARRNVADEGILQMIALCDRMD
jgi:hypothetical protein